MIKSSDHETWFEKGILCQEQENYSEALNCFEKSINFNPHFIPAWVYKGIILEQLEDYQAAIRCYEEAIKINPDATDLWYNKGASYSYAHLYEKGLECFNHVLQLDPNHALCKTTLALTLATIPQPIKLPKLPNTERENLPIEAEVSISISLPRERAINREGEMELD